VGARPENYARRLLGRLDGGVLSVVDQIVVSGSNFASTLILARSLDVAQFGRFWLGFTVLSLVAAIQNGFLLTPLALRGSVLDEEEFERYVGAHIVIQMVFVAASGLLTALLAVPLVALRPIAPALVASTIAYGLQAFCRRALYTRARVRAAVINDIVSYALQAAILGLTWLAVGLTESLALWIIALTSFLAFLVGFRQLGLFRRTPISPIRDVIRGDFQLGKWTGSVEGIAIVSTYAWAVILSVVVGLKATAGYGVIVQTFGPLRLLLRPFDNYYLAVASRALTREGTKSVKEILSRALVLFAPPYFLYVAAIGVFGPTLLPLVFGEPYRHSADAIRVFAFAAALELPCALLGVEINARRLLHVSLIEVAVAAVLTYTVGIFLAMRWELIGVGVSQSLALMFQICLFAVFVARARASALATSVSESGLVR
jgi:O-antigen/teichoic acid export membrane protein